MAKPKDFWKVGKKLLELQKKFPHDRVIERMLQNEFRTNKVFRYPEEYDVFDQEKDEKLKHVTEKVVKKAYEKEKFSKHTLHLERSKQIDVN